MSASTASSPSIARCWAIWPCSLGDEAAAARHFAEHAALAAAISEKLWDDERGVFANRLTDGAFIRPIAPTSFYPLAAGAATAEQAEALVSGWLDAPERFGGAFGLPSITRDDPAFADNVYWRGRIWGPMNFWTYTGLRRAGLDAAAAGVARRGQALFDLSWRDRLCGENYNADHGAIFDGSDADGFYAWGALLPLATVSEIVSLDPWSGLSLTPSAAEGGIGPVATPAGALTLAAQSGAWTVSRAGVPALSGDLSGRLTSVEIGADRIAATLAPQPRDGAVTTCGRAIVRATLDGAPLAPAGDRLAIPAAAGPRRLILET
jgi:putative isomerase